MVVYNLNHLTQSTDQNVSGPIQDDEALFLFALIRGSRLSRILEIGGLDGYSARNFLAALEYPRGPRETSPVLYTCDINPVSSLSENHRILTKNALDLIPSDLDNAPLDLVFFDCHDMIQMSIYHTLCQSGLITDRTVLALHDTNLHYPPFQHCGQFVPEEGGFAHQPVEREMVRSFRAMGYQVFGIRTDASKHSEVFPVRHGLTVCQRF